METMDVRRFSVRDKGTLTAATPSCDSGEGVEGQRADLNISCDKRTGGNSREFIFRSGRMQRLNYEIARIAQFDFDVLLLGETGVGKDLIAAEIHRRSGRSDNPFLPIPLRSLNPTLLESELFGHERGAFSGAEVAKPGKFEVAHHGTVYIPEISSLSEDIQLKLLYFMQYKSCLRVGEDPRHRERCCDVRLIFASNDDLDDLVRDGSLREDFYYRIKGLSVKIPPLRERIEDIEVLAKHFIEKYGLGASFTLCDSALNDMMQYSWPGNVRELENMIKAEIPFAEDGVIAPGSLQPYGGSHAGADDLRRYVQGRKTLPSFDRILEELRTVYFADVMRRAGRHVPTAAQIAGMSEQGFRKALRKLQEI
ncbi:sigma 54-interacting transcriptional regulator [bacterium]|nr:sigma 54-interacting transcriptional regulator [bacterium]